MKTIISTIISLTFIATVILTVLFLIHRANTWNKRNKYNKFINPKNTEKMLQDELAAEFQDYINSEQIRSRREHPTNFRHKNSELNSETKKIISGISNESPTPPRRDEFGKFIASKYRNQS